MSNRWERVRRSLPCAFWHPINYPDWAYFAKWRCVLCEACAWKQYKLAPPSLVPDVKLRAAGERE